MSSSLSAAAVKASAIVKTIIELLREKPERAVKISTDGAFKDSKTPKSR